MAATSGCIAPPTLRPAPLHRHHQGSWQSSPVYSGDARSGSKTTQCLQLINPLAICTFSINCAKKYQFYQILHKQIYISLGPVCRLQSFFPCAISGHDHRWDSSSLSSSPVLCSLRQANQKFSIKHLICRINILNATHFSSATRTHTQSHAGDVRTLPTFLHLVFPGVPPLVPAGGSDITPAGGKNQWDFSTAASLRHGPIHAPLIAQRLGGKTVWPSTN